MLGPVLLSTAEVGLPEDEIELTVRVVPGMVLRFRIVLERTQKLPTTIERFNIGFALVPPQMVNANHHLSANLFRIGKIADFRTFVEAVR